MADQKASGKSRKLTDEEAAAAALSVAKGLELAHGGGLAHRESEANNILLDEPDAIDKFLRRIPLPETGIGSGQDRANVDLRIVP